VIKKFATFGIVVVFIDQTGGKWWELQVRLVKLAVGEWFSAGPVGQWGSMELYSPIIVTKEVLMNYWNY
jgi:hypothetical protein